MYRTTSKCVIAINTDKILDYFLLIMVHVPLILK